MKKQIMCLWLLIFSVGFLPLSHAEQEQYVVGIGDILNITVLQPDQLSADVTVAPDGTISFPYIGNVGVKGFTLPEIQKGIELRLGDGYMNYPVVSVALEESHSQNFYVYGEVKRPGSFSLDEKTTVLKAISMAGGFTKYGSASRVKILREKVSGEGYQPIKVEIKAVMEGDMKEDMPIKAGDIVVVQEGVF